MFQKNPCGALLATFTNKASLNRLVFLCLLAALISIAGLVMVMAGFVANGHEPDAARYAFIGGGAGFVATALGATFAITLRRLSDEIQSNMLSFASGMMLAASFLSLILPGFDAANSILENKFMAAGTVVLGLALGATLISCLDRFLPHDQVFALSYGTGAGLAGASRVWLFVMAIAIHNFPEGMAVGVGFGGDPELGVSLATAIAIQDVPEGLAVAMALRAIGLSIPVSCLVAAATGVMEPVGAMFGLAVTSGFAISFPLSLGFAAGAMLFVVCNNIIPETCGRGGKGRPGLSLMSGLCVMVFLDAALG
ncbi:ZIP family metal transporter [Pseudomonas stutzeri]|uniref:ZIP family metal transporter n=1 Tax=Stutzerimonas stutzeri TaxID=316 RepID=UPI00210AB747|nr:ZIP family metal transporter [Stutzerimonas stutzeri]MCQ4314312.1 ZIP family metal transporter [Stutzerimonas stutzeri]